MLSSVNKCRLHRICLICAALCVVYFLMQIVSRDDYKKIAEEKIKLYKNECGISSIHEDKRPIGPIARIAGGSNAVNYEYPWMALVHNKLWGKNCGGTLVGPRHVLTAGHCVNYVPKYVLDNGAIRVYIGDVDKFVISSKYFADEFMYIVKDIQKHPNFLQYNRGTLYDLAILLLKEDVIVTSSVRPVCLPTNHMNIHLQYNSVTIIGWGMTSPPLKGEDEEAKSKRIPRILQKSQIKIQDFAHCHRVWKNEMTDSRFCGGDRFHNTCHGDSGGPALINNLADGKFYQVGVSSLSYCGIRNWPGIFENVLNHVDWINDVIHDTLADALEKENKIKKAYIVK